MNQTSHKLRCQLTHLNPGATYHYRLVAVNETGTSYGEDATLEAK